MKILLKDLFSEKGFQFFILAKDNSTMWKYFHFPKEQKF